MSEPPPHTEDLTVGRWAQFESREIEAQYREHFRDYERLMLTSPWAPAGHGTKLQLVF